MGLRSHIESKRRSKSIFWNFIIGIKDWFARKFKGKTTIPSTYRKDLRFYKQFIKKGDLVFDIGANHGQKSEVFLHIGAEVVAVEPQPECIQDLTNKFQKNQNFQVVPKGLGSEEGVQTMYISESSDMVSTFSTDWQKGRFESSVNWGEKMDLELTTFDTLIKQYGHPDFCKIDVEGFELEVFKGLNQKVKCLGFEFAEEFRDSTLIILNKLKELNFQEFNFAESEFYELKFKEWVSYDDMETFIKNTDPNRKSLWGDIYARA